MKQNKLLMYLLFAVVMTFVFIIGLPPLDEAKGVLSTACLFYLSAGVIFSALKDFTNLSKKVQMTSYFSGLLFLIGLLVGSIVYSEIFVLTFSLVFLIATGLKIFLNLKKQGKKGMSLLP